MWFTDGKGNKVNTENSKPGISSGQMHDKGSDIITEGDKTFKKIQVFKFDNLPEDVQQKVIEKYRNNMSDDDWYSQDEGLIYDAKTKIAGYEIFKNVFPKHWSVGYGHMWVQFDLEIKDENKFKEEFGISNGLWKKISVEFDNGDRTTEENTRIKFYDETGDEIEEGHNYNHEELSKAELHEIDDARKKFDDLMQDAVINLNKSYEYQQSDEAIIENIKANDYDFDEDGDMV
jgi:hypothetical protein